MVVFRVLAPTIVSAACFWRAAAGLHIDVSHNGDISIDVESNSAVEDAPRRAVHALESDKDYQVDLWHGTHQGQLMKDGSFEYVKFANIPYASAPNEYETRWAPPYPPPDGEGLYNDSGTRVCPQVIPGWGSKALEFLNDFKGTADLPAKWKTPITPDQYPPLPDTLIGDEDCLYLDVYVPKDSWERRDERRFFKPRAVVFIPGGGFTYGSKDDIGSPSGLMKSINMTENPGVVLISINYRLGMFGWLGGPKYNDEVGQANLGLLDQEAAIKWVEDNIYLFGATPEFTTLMGQSAGAASIQYLLTRPQNRYFRDLPIKKAIVQSPASFPLLDGKAADDLYDKILSEAEAKDFNDLANATSDALKKVNAKIIHSSTYGQFTFGPTVDGYLTEDVPAARFAKDKFQSQVFTLGGYTGFDGLIFTPPWIRDTAALKKHVRSVFPQISDAAVEEIGRLYPLAPGDGPIASRLQILAVSDMLNDVAIKCNVHAHSAAASRGSSPFDGQFRYVFDAAPSVHGSDLNYIFYPSTPFKGVGADKDLANAMQHAWADFIQYFDTNPEGLDDEDPAYWGLYTNETRKIAKLGHTSAGKTDFKFAIEDDPMGEANRKKCEFWIQKPYAPAKQSDRSFRVQQPEL